VAAAWGHLAAERGAAARFILWNNDPQLTPTPVVGYRVPAECARARTSDYPHFLAWSTKRGLSGG
jgi:hypothetical protein